MKLQGKEVAGIVTRMKRKMEVDMITFYILAKQFFQPQYIVL